MGGYRDRRKTSDTLAIIAVRCSDCMSSLFLDIEKVHWRTNGQIVECMNQS